jgi:hypothetical protein
VCVCVATVCAALHLHSGAATLLLAHTRKQREAADVVTIVLLTHNCAACTRAPAAAPLLPCR